MNLQFLAALILLMRPDVTPLAARLAAQQALDCVQLPHDASKPSRRRLPPGALRDRVVSVLRAMPYAPSRRELYTQVTGNRDAVHKTVTAMIADGTVVVHKSKRQIGLLLADGTSMRDAPTVKT